jgi:hypothetical protein
MFCAWLDLRNKRTEIMGAAWNGRDKTWSENRLIYRSPDGSVCECCHPSVTYGGDGSLHVMWRNSLDGNRDMYSVVSTDGGESFERAMKLGAGAWPLNACPMDGGAIAARSKSEAYTVWRRDKTVYLTSGRDRPEQKLGEGEQPWLALTASGPLPCWVNRRGGELFMKLPGDSVASELASGAWDPVCVAVKDLVLVAWESGDKQHPSAYVRRIPVNGSTHPE